MAEKSVLIVIDMQNGVFATPRYDRAGRVARINRLTAAADHTLFIQHVEGEMTEGSALWQLLPELSRPARSITLVKTACDAFYRTPLEAVLDELGARHLTLCGCATDYCVDTTIKVAASKGYALTIASDAHTTANRRYASAPQLIGQHNEVWSELAIPGNHISVKATEHILQDWQS